MAQAPLSVYVGAAWDDAPQVREAYAALRARGAVITRPWAEITADIESGRTRGEEAVSMQTAVADADVVVVLVTDPNYPYRGLTFELATALAWHTPIVLATALSDDCFTMENVALHHPAIQRVGTLAEAIDAALVPPPPPPCSTTQGAADHLAASGSISSGGFAAAPRPLPDDCPGPWAHDNSIVSSGDAERT